MLTGTILPYFYLVANYFTTRTVSAGISLSECIPYSQRDFFQEFFLIKKSPDSREHHQEKHEHGQEGPRLPVVERPCRKKEERSHDDENEQKPAEGFCLEMFMLFVDPPF
jgi:hypothetical protein